MSHCNRLNRRDFLRTSAVAGTAAALAAPAWAEETERPLPWRVGVGMAEITPPLEVGILMSAAGRWAPFEGVRLPLHARAVVIRKGNHRVAMVSLDLLGLAGEAVGGMKQFKEQVAAAAGHAVRADDLVLASTHTHSGPASLALTDLIHTEDFKSWVGHLAQRIGSAVRSAAGSMRPCKLVVGCQSAPGLAIYRRIMTNRGIKQPHVIRPADIVIGPEGPADDSVHIAAFADQSGRPVAVLVNATAHPIHEMCLRQVSPDYPGEMSIELERRHPGLVALFLQGAAGNINSPGVSGGAADARRHGQRLAELVDKALGGLRPVEGDELALCWRSVKLAARDPSGQPVAEPLSITIGAARIGNAVFVFLPGEPFIETALAIRKVPPVSFMQVVGYAEAYIGYIPTDLAFDNGGYEPGPGRWSRVARGSEPIVRKEAMKLLHVVRGTETENSN